MGARRTRPRAEVMSNVLSAIWRNADTRATAFPYGSSWRMESNLPFWCSISRLWRWSAEDNNRLSPLSCRESYCSEEMESLAGGCWQAQMAQATNTGVVGRWNCLQFQIVGVGYVRFECATLSVVAFLNGFDRIVQKKVWNRRRDQQQPLPNTQQLPFSEAAKHKQYTFHHQFKYFH